LKQYPDTYTLEEEHQVACYLYSPEEIATTLQEITDHPPTYPVQFQDALGGV
jgi:hypothetical protein